MMNGYEEWPIQHIYAAWMYLIALVVMLSTLTDSMGFGDIDLGSVHS